MSIFLATYVHPVLTVLCTRYASKEQSEMKSSEKKNDGVRDTGGSVFLLMIVAFIGVGFHRMI